MGRQQLSVQGPPNVTLYSQGPSKQILARSWAHISAIKYQIVQGPPIQYFGCSGAHCFGISPFTNEQIPFSFGSQGLISNISKEIEHPRLEPRETWPSSKIGI